jgi:glycosyltransferase involved in cell wall biosynthesis
MISVIIPALNAERTLAFTLSGLLEAHIDGVAREVIVVDRGSQDVTARIAEEAGATLSSAPGANTAQAILNAAAEAKFSWLLILEPGTAPEPGFARAAAQYIQAREQGRAEAGFFKFASYQGGPKGFVRNQVYALRSLAGMAPQLQQGLLVERRLLVQAKASGATDLSALLRDLSFTELKARIAVLDATYRGASDAASAEPAQISLANR